MTEEEKKTIEYWKEQKQQFINAQNGFKREVDDKAHLKNILTELQIDIDNIDLMLNLIQKQQEEIERLIKINRELKKSYKNIFYNSISKDKIREKIEEMQQIANKADTIPETVKEERLDGTIVYSKRFKADGYIAQAIIKILQDLLESEEA